MGTNLSAQFDDILAELSNPQDAIPESFTLVTTGQPVL
jgi:hypothetical protein